MESPNTKELDQKALTKVDEAKNFMIIDNPSYELAGAFLVAIKGLRKEVNAVFDPIVSKAFATHREAVSQKKLKSEPLDSAELIIKDKISAYLAECERIRREEQRRLEEEARKQREIQLQREAAERKKREDEALRQAKLAEEAGDKEAAESLLNEAEEAAQEPVEVELPPVVAPKVESRVNGISQRKVWKWRIAKEQLVKRQFLMLDDRKINAQVRAMGKDAEQIVGGIQVYETSSISARS